MSSEPLSDSVAAFLKQPNPAVMATLGKDGRPVTVATWYLFEDDGRVLLNLDAGRARLKHLENDPRVSLTVLDKDNWYTHVSLQGRVEELTDDVGLQDIDALSRHYGGNPYPNRERPRVSGRLVIERWHVWGDLDD